MKNYVILAAFASLVLAPMLANAQIPAGTAPEGAGAPPADGQTFQQHKDKVLKHIGQHFAELQKTQSCVAASTDEDSLKACHSKHAHMHGGKKWGHPISADHGAPAGGEATTAPVTPAN